VLGLCPQRTPDRLPPSFGRETATGQVGRNALQPGPREAAPPFAPRSRRQAPGSSAPFALEPVSPGG